tara:strand:+ start:1739 stop:2365 length:627 start_codon:yes stop_codon:yes gene_type:complete
VNEGYRQIIDSISSPDPTPGGGSVSALVLSHAHSLALMVSRLTLGKEKWADGQSISKKIISSSSQGVESSLDLAKKDATAFDMVMDSYRLPKDTEALKETRKKSIQKSTIRAATVPLEIMRESTKLMETITDLARYGNSNALTDLLGAADLAKTSTTIASYNVRINLDDLDPCDEKTSITNELDKLARTNVESYKVIRNVILERLKWD